MENNVHVCKDCLSHLKLGEIGGKVEKEEEDINKKTLKDILAFCLPHLTLQDINKLSICAKCMSRLRNLHEFITNTTTQNVLSNTTTTFPDNLQDFVAMSKKTFTLNEQPSNRKGQQHRKRKHVRPKRLKPATHHNFKRIVNGKPGGNSCLSLGELWRGRETLLNKRARRVCKKCGSHLTSGQLCRHAKACLNFN